MLRSINFGIKSMQFVYIRCFYLFKSKMKGAAMTSVSGDYNSFISKLESQGLQTTWLASGETNFQQYADALSSDLKNEILQSFDNQQDYVLQQKLAELFKSTNVVDSGSFISACQSLGLSCSVEYVSTSYIVDYKSSQSGEVTSGAIAVYTISDGQGGEIKIADANGNGYVESEELFMNEILGDINNEISGGVNASNTALTGVDGTKNEGPSQEEFNAKVEEYILNGFSKEEAVRLANIVLKTENAQYTGTMESVSQDKFNEAVENHMRQGASRDNAIIVARAELHVNNMQYTGNGIEDGDSDSMYADNGETAQYGTGMIYENLASEYSDNKEDEENKDEEAA